MHSHVSATCTQFRISAEDTTCSILRLTSAQVPERSLSASIARDRCMHSHMLGASSTVQRIIKLEAPLHSYSSRLPPLAIRHGSDRESRHELGCNQLAATTAMLAGASDSPCHLSSRPYPKQPALSDQRRLAERCRASQQYAPLPPPGTVKSHLMTRAPASCAGSSSQMSKPGGVPASGNSRTSAKRRTRREHSRSLGWRSPWVASCGPGVIRHRSNRRRRRSRRYATSSGGPRVGRRPHVRPRCSASSCLSSPLSHNVCSAMPPML